MDMGESNAAIDEALIPLSQVVESFLMISEPDSGMPLALCVDRIVVDFPLELQVEISQEENLILGAAPPTQRIETSFMPVFHRLKITIGRREGSRHG